MEWHGYSAVQAARNDYLEHHGVKGMRWRNRKGPNVPGAIQNVVSQTQQYTQNGAANGNHGNGNTIVGSAGQSGANAISSANAQIQEQIHPTSTYKEAKKSKRFSFFSNILSKLKKLFD